MNKKTKIIIIAVAAVLIIGVIALCAFLTLRNSIFGRYSGFLCEIEFSGVDKVTVYRGDEKFVGRYTIKYYEENDIRTISFDFGDTSSCSDLMKEAVISLGINQTLEFVEGEDAIRISVNKYTKVEK